MLFRSTQFIKTGLFLGDVNSIVISKIKEDSIVEKRILEAYNQKIGRSYLALNNFERLKESSNNLDSVKSNEEIKSGSEKANKIVKVRVDMDFYELITTSAKRLNVDTSTYIRYCIRTGIYLEDLNKYIQMKSEETE